jgi:hypothetical protein
MHPLYLLVSEVRTDTAVRNSGRTASNDHTDCILAGIFWTKPVFVVHQGNFTIVACAAWMTNSNTVNDNYPHHLTITVNPQAFVAEVT